MKRFSSNFKIELDTTDQKLKNNLIILLNESGFKTPNLNELAKHFKNNENHILKILTVEKNNNNLIIINGEYIFTNENYLKLVKKLDNHFKSHETLSIKEFKVISQTSRKYAVPLLEYLDQIREVRTGVTKYNQGLDSESLNKTATGISTIMNQTQMRSELIARIFAETGVKDLFRKMFALSIKYQDKEKIIQTENIYFFIFQY